MVEESPIDYRIGTIADKLKVANASYRKGLPTMSDDDYDNLVEGLKAVAPDHPYLHTVEPEEVGKKEVRHPEPMLSMAKAYTVDELNRFFDRVEKAADEIADVGMEGFKRLIVYRVTPKLDGIAGRDDGKIFATRGNGAVGNDITDAFVKGVVPIGGRGKGIGEIVLLQEYFDRHLSEQFKHPRNVVAGLIGADDLNKFAKKALLNGAIVFFPYSELYGNMIYREDIIGHIDSIYTENTDCPYPIDGIVISVEDFDIRSHMGSTSHHHSWQIAYKVKGESAITIVNSVTWQVGRTGKITPVLEIKPVELSGATIRRVTAHNAGYVLGHEIGKGSEIRIIRSGEVIPKIEEVTSYSDESEPFVPHKCPSCDSLLFWENDFLMCRNQRCDEKIIRGMIHWFSTLGIDWFGRKAMEKIVQGGCRTVPDIYDLNQDDLRAMGFGSGESERLWKSCLDSLSKPVEDWRFLAAFGIPDLGKGDSKKLLKHHSIKTITDIEEDEIDSIDGFGEKTSKSIPNGISDIAGFIDSMLDMNFNLIATIRGFELEEIQSPISGKKIVFTGKMSKSRDEMKTQAEEFGAIPQSGLSKSTDLFVFGENAGAKKVEKAESLGVHAVSEDEYREIIGE